MKRNLNRLIAQIQFGASRSSKGRFKITAKQINQYTNKILVNANQLNKPSTTQKIINEEMKEYRQHKRINFELFQQGVKQKAIRPISLQDQIIKLQKCFDILLMEDIMTGIRTSRKNDLAMIRNKLIKLESYVSSKLVQENLEAHIELYLQNYLQELNEIINKTSKQF